MLEALWSAFSHPSTIVGRDGAGNLLLAAAAAVLITAAFMATIGRRLMRHSPLFAILAGLAFLPLLMNALAFTMAWNSPKGTDLGGILVFATLVLSICVLPVTLATSVVYVFIRRRFAVH